MHCASCEILIGEGLKDLPGVNQVKVDQKRGEAEISYAGREPSAKDIRRIVQEAGYEVGKKEKLPWISTSVRDYSDLFRAGIILSAVYLIAKWLNLFNLDIGSAQNGGVFVALLVGLVAGVSTCMALVGGLILGLSARHAELHPEATALQKFRPHIYFNLGRIVSYAVLGGVIGSAGAIFRPSVNLLGFLTMIIGGVMLFFGLKLIEIFPVLKDKSITLPSGLAKIFGLHKDVKEYSPKSSMFMGGLTFFLPCGFTQAMQLYAVSTGSFWSGMALMGLFAVGTAPGLLGIGGLTSIFKGRKGRIFFMTAGLAVIILGWINIANGSRLFSGNAAPANGVVSTSEVQEVRMTQTGSGYSPNVFTVVKNKTVRWIIDSKSSFSCASSLVMPKFGISKSLSLGENIIEFTPTEAGEIPFSCSMGMYGGKFIVIGSAGSNAGAIPVAAAQTAGANTFGGGGGCGGGGGGCGGGGGGCGGGNRKPIQTQVGTVTEQPTSNEQVIKSTYTYNDDIVPNTFTVKKGQPVRYIVDVKENGYGCMGTIMVPGLFNSPERLTAGREIVMTFTPDRTGDFTISCAMGVPRGRIAVID